MKEEITLDTVPTKHLFFAIISNRFKNIPLCKYLCSSDLIDSYYVAFYKAKEKFNPDNGTKFSTYVYTCIINMAIKNLKRKRPICFSELSPDEMVKIMSNEDKYDNQAEQAKIYTYELLKLAKLTESELDLIKKRFYLDTPAKVIAEQENCSRQRINQRMQTIYKKLKEVASYANDESEF